MQRLARTSLFVVLISALVVSPIAAGEQPSGNAGLSGIAQWIEELVPEWVQQVLSGDWAAAPEASQDEPTPDPNEPPPASGPIEDEPGEETHPIVEPVG